MPTFAVPASASSGPFDDLLQYAQYFMVCTNMMQGGRLY